jgi:hypothetical protein
VPAGAFAVNTPETQPGGSLEPVGSAWVFVWRLANRSVGTKRCENAGCDEPAANIMADATAIYYACAKCTPLIPKGRILTALKPNVPSCGAGQKPMTKPKTQSGGSMKPVDSALTAADKAALEWLPADWFGLNKVTFRVRNPRWRCDRLTQKGMLESRVIGEYPDIQSQWRKTPHRSRLVTANTKVSSGAKRKPARPPRRAGQLNHE